ncbi:MAG: hypothetical protein V4501_10260 [Pseudomonadota bacterium]
MDSRRTTNSINPYDMVIQQLFHYLVVNPNISKKLTTFILFLQIYQAQNLGPERLFEAPDLFKQELNHFLATNPGLKSKERKVLDSLQHGYAQQAHYTLNHKLFKITKLLPITEAISEKNDTPLSRVKLGRSASNN